MATFKVKVSGSIIGDVYAFTIHGQDGEGTAYSHVTRILFNSSGPKLMYGAGGLTPIDNPHRFGDWDTKAQRREYCRRFAED